MYRVQRVEYYILGEYIHIWVVLYSENKSPTTVPTCVQFKFFLNLENYILFSQNTEDQIETPSETHTVDQSDMTLKQEGPENSGQSNSCC